MRILFKTSEHQYQTTEHRIAIPAVVDLCRFYLNLKTEESSYKKQYFQGNLIYNIDQSQNRSLRATLEYTRWQSSRTSCNQKSAYSESLWDEYIEHKYYD